RLLERRLVEADAAIEDGAAVLRLTDLEIRRVLAGLQRVALRVDDEEPRELAAHLAADDEVDVELELVALQRGAVHVRHPPHLLADDARGVVERGRLSQPLALVEITPELRDDRLRAGEAAAAEQDEDALAGLREHVHLARDVHLIVARVAARVGRHHETLPCPDADAVRHPGIVAEAGRRAVLRWAHGDPPGLRAALRGAPAHPDAAHALRPPRAGVAAAAAGADRDRAGHRRRGLRRRVRQPRRAHPGAGGHRAGPVRQRDRRLRARRDADHRRAPDTGARDAARVLALPPGEPL